MTYQKTLEQMDDEEMHTAVSTIFHGNNALRRSREQNSALLLSWLDTIHLNPKTHRFQFVRDEQNEVWLLNRRQVDCECCREKQPFTNYSTTTPSIKFKKSNPKKKKEHIVTQQPLPLSSGHFGPPSKQARKKEEPNCCRDCCSECANICSNILSS